MRHPQNITAAAAAAADNLQTPAYTGARFNSLGFCISHHNVRLCTVTSGGKYKILRKICPKCGSNSLRSNLTRFRVNTLHGLGKKELPTRDVPKDMLSAIEGGSSSGGDNMKVKSSDKAAKKSSGPLLEKNGTDMKKKSVLPQPNTKVRQSKRSTASPPTPQLEGGKSKSELKPRHELPGGQPPSQQRPRSKSRTRKKTTRKEDDKSSRIRSSTPIPDKPARSRSSTPIPITMSSSKSVEAKVKEITNKFAVGTLEKAVDYAELGKLITMKDDENTLPTVPSAQSTMNKSVEEKVKELTKSLVANYTELDKLLKMKDDESTLPTSPSQSTNPGPFKRQLSELTSGSFKSKQAILSIDESGLIVELYEKNSDGLVGQEKKNIGSGNGLKLRRSSKLKQKILTN